MRRGRVFIYLGLILILGLVAVGILFFRNQQAPAPIGVEVTAEPEVPKAAVVIMTQSVKRGQRITEDVIGVVQISQEDVIEGMFTETEDVIGSFAKFDLVAGVYITQGVVVDKGEELSSAGSDHAIFIPPGMVAVSIPVDRLASVAYGVDRGDHVNVIVTLLMVDLDADFQSKLPNSSSSILAPGPGLLVTLSQAVEGGPDEVSSSVFVDELLQTLVAQVATGGVVSPIGRLELDQQMGQPFYIVPSEPQRPRLVSQTLIQNVIVLQMGSFPLEGVETVVAEPTPEEEQPPQDAGADQAQPVETVMPPDIVTLIVSPQDAVTLNYLLLNDGARLSLALRSAGDDSLAATEAVTLQFLIDQYNIPLPTKLPYGLEPRLDLIVPPVLLNDIPPVTSEQ
jgi:pilus assembly protein CpaB